MAQPYWAGWDGGGTKTEVLCVDARGETLGCQSFGPLNLNGADPDRIAVTIRDSLAFMAARPGGLSACRGLVIGTAGVSNAAAGRLVEDTVRQWGYTGNLFLTGDQDIALAGAIEGSGAVLVAGTGSVCCGRNLQTGAHARSGGYGYLIDDEGSGYAIGRDILTAVVRAQDGRARPTALTQLVYEALGVDSVGQIITWLYGPGTGKKEVAALAPLLRPALTAGDDAARAIVGKAGRELALLAVALWRRLELTDGQLALTGSILNRYEEIRSLTAAQCSAACLGMTIRSPRGSPAQGAARMAREMFSE